MNLHFEEIPLHWITWVKMALNCTALRCVAVTAGCGQYNLVCVCVWTCELAVTNEIRTRSWSPRWGVTVVTVRDESYWKEKAKYEILQHGLIWFLNFIWFHIVSYSFIVFGSSLRLSGGLGRVDLRRCHAVQAQDTGLAQLGTFETGMAWEALSSDKETDRFLC